jgi:hypothetical protein
MNSIGTPNQGVYPSVHQELVRGMPTELSLKRNTKFHCVSFKSVILLYHKVQLTVSVKSVEFVKGVHIMQMGCPVNYLTLQP